MRHLAHSGYDHHLGPLVRFLLAADGTNIPLQNPPCLLSVFVFLKVHNTSSCAGLVAFATTNEYLVEPSSFKTQSSSKLILSDAVHMHGTDSASGPTTWRWIGTNGLCQNCGNDVDRPTGTILEYRLQHFTATSGWSRYRVSSYILKSRLFAVQN